MNRTYRLKQKFPDSNEAPAMPANQDCSREPILDSTLQINKAFPHGSDLVVSAHVMTGLSWQPSWGTEHTYRSFRLDGIRCLAEHVTHTTVLPPDHPDSCDQDAAGGIIERSHSNTVIDYESPNAALSSPCLHLRTFHIASPIRTSATGPYQCAVVRNTGGARGGYVNRCVNDIRRRPSQPLIQWRFHPHTVHRDRRLRSTQGPSDA